MSATGGQDSANIKWPQVSLSSVCDVRDGTHESPKYYQYGVPLVTSKHLHHREIRVHDAPLISRRDAERIDARSKVSRNDVLMSMIGTVGNAVLVRDEPRFCIKNIALLKPKNISPRYLLHFVSGPVFQGRIEAGATGGIQSFISLGKLRETTIDLPSSVEQEAIANSLDEADAMVASLERLIAKKQAITQGMMQQLFTGMTRLPGFTGTWQVTRLAELGQCLRGVGYDPRTDLSPGDRASTVRLLRSNNIQDGAVVLDELQFVHERRVDAQQVLQPGDVVICMSNGSRALVGKSAYFDKSEPSLRYTFGAFMAAFRTNKRQADPRFIAQLLRTNAFRRWLDVILAGSSINNLRRGDIENFQVPAPSHHEQSAIADVVQDSEREVEVLRDRLVKANAIKRGMMQELLTGRTRLVVSEAVA